MESVFLLKFISKANTLSLILSRTASGMSEAVESTLITTRIPQDSLFIKK